MYGKKFTRSFINFLKHNGFIFPMIVFSKETTDKTAYYGRFLLH